MKQSVTLSLYAGFLRRAGRTAEAETAEAQSADIRKNAAKSAASATPKDLPAGVYRVGNGITAPSVTSKPEPEYSEEARLAKFSGESVLSLEIGPDGVPFNIQVVQPLGLGLDEKAVDAVSQWRFTPGTKNGAPVTIMAQVAVNFRLL